MPKANRGPAILEAGTGPDALVLKVSQDAYQGGAQYTVSVDGQQVGGTFTASSLRLSGASDTLTLKGDWGPGEHRVEVAFLNDAWGGTADTDRNLYVDAAAYNGQAVGGAEASLWSAGAASFSFTEAAAPKPPEPPQPPASASPEAGTGPDALVLKVSQDAWQGSAQYTVKVDGVQVGGTFAASASHAFGKSDTLTLKGDWKGGVHQVEVQFLNDAWGGTAAADRNLYVEGATYDGVAVPGAKAALHDDDAPFHFSFTDPEPPPPPPPPAGGELAPNAPVSGLKLTFNDDFDSFDWEQGWTTWDGRQVGWDVAVDGTWKTVFPGGERTLVSNHEMEFYSDGWVGKHPFRIENGALVITAEPSPDPSKTGGLPYTSGLITSEKGFTQTYGYFEARIDIPQGQGLWPAFWMGNANRVWPPEIDVVEVVNNRPEAVVNVHSQANGHHEMFQDWNWTPDIFEGFHTYGVSWRPDKVDFYVDGEHVHSVATPADLHSPMFMMANLAVGGDWPGAPDGSTQFPAEMAIDHIRAWQYDDLV